MRFHSLTMAILALIMMFCTTPTHAQSLPDTDRTLPPEAYDLKNVPDEYIEEALTFADYCEGRESMRQHYNCQCLSTKYLDKRIEGGDRIGRSSIMLAIEEKCADATEAAGVRYQECLGNATLMGVNGDPEEFCQCYANEYAKIYERLSPEPGSTMFVAIQSRAMMHCQNPELAKRFYK